MKKIREEHPSSPSVLMVGVIKEVAPNANATTDDELGVAVFQKDYFAGFPVFLDTDLAFYKALGNRKVSLPSWNPFKLWADFKDVKTRIEKKDIGGNFAGEGLTLGGVLVLGPGELGVVHEHLEQVGQSPDEWVPGVKQAILSLPQAP